MEDKDDLVMIDPLCLFPLMEWVGLGAGQLCYSLIKGISNLKIQN